MRVDSHPALRSWNFSPRGGVFNAPDNTGNPPSVLLDAHATPKFFLMKRDAAIRNNVRLFCVVTGTTMFPVTGDPSHVTSC